MLVAQGLQKSFRTRQVVQDFGFEIRQGEVVGLLGPNGAGKTTCFYMVVGLIEPDGGRITLDGEDITGLPMHQRRSEERRVGKSVGDGVRGVRRGKKSGVK